jgi:hypothetical protein
MIVYRIENNQGHGPFFRKDGTPRDGAPFKNLVGIYGFWHQIFFLKKEYRKYYFDPDYLLYKIIIRKPLHIYLNGEVRFNESDIVFKIPINKSYARNCIK